MGAHGGRRQLRWSQAAGEGSGGGGLVGSLPSRAASGQSATAELPVCRGLVSGGFGLRAGRSELLMDRTGSRSRPSAHYAPAVEWAVRLGLRSPCGLRVL